MKIASFLLFVALIMPSSMLSGQLGKDTFTADQDGIERLLVGSKFSFPQAAVICDKAALQGRFDVLSFALRWSPGPLPSYILSDVYPKLTVSQQASLLSEVFSDNSLWPPAEAIHQQLHPTQLEWKQKELYHYASRLLGLSPELNKYLEIDDRRKLVAQLRQLSEHSDANNRMQRPFADQGQQPSLPNAPPASKNLFPTDPRIPIDPLETPRTRKGNENETTHNHLPLGLIVGGIMALISSALLLYRRGRF